MTDKEALKGGMRKESENSLECYGTSEWTRRALRRGQT